MLRPGDIITVEFPGVERTKRRPAVVVSTEDYHRHRPDVIIGLLTSQTQDATAPTDHILQDWAEAGLHRPSAFRTFLATLPAKVVTRIGRCSDRDWQAIQDSLRMSIAT
ncbi:MAG: type II toxin-antitoxin system PemK/MazF family toxin [Anaerolineae bacterium]